ncbi:hypothetical protein D3C81_1510590 [compost metagenome]
MGQFGVAAQQAGPDRDRDVAFGAGERPFVLGRGQAHGDAAVAGQVLGVTQRRVRAQVAGRGTEDDLCRDQRPCHQVRAEAQVGQHHAHVAAFFHDIDDAVREQHVEYHVRVELLEAFQSLRQQVQAEHDRRHQPQRARERLTARRDHRLGFFHILEDLAAALEVGFAGVCQRQAARGAVQQPGAQVAFQVRHIARDHGIGHFQLLRRTCKTAKFHHLGEDAHRLKPIHDIVSRFTRELLHDPGDLL